MAQIEDNSGKRSTSAEVNLVPFIDLMSVCIIFLLITSVWTQVSMIQLGSSVYGKNNTDKQVNVEDPEKKDINLQLRIIPEGYEIVYTDATGNKRLPVAKQGEEYDKLALYERLKSIKEQYPDSKVAYVKVAEILTYDNMVTGMDILMQSGFSDIVVATGEN